ncbi:hypothetical protein D3C87_1022310 [compost metagenome]|uniref:DUF4194 domain-containing protein n=1 Tax=Variovorax boronicumulans TaxID=436515 RepID=UPI000FC20971|nr:DUF4194 domain-containing protein [Variovorax boronicumulans]PBI85490.1 hypothetical protein BKP43_47620 [Variovorax boronicumulans]
MSLDDGFQSPAIGGIPRFLLRGGAEGNGPVDGATGLAQDVASFMTPTTVPPSTVAAHFPLPSGAASSLIDMLPEGDIALDANEGPVRTDGLFSGDTGTLLGETRRTLVQLLTGPSVDGRRQPQLWSVLLRDRRDIASRLNDLFLELVVDTDQRVAFVRQATGSDDDDLPILLRRQPLTFIDSALVLHLRQRLTEADRADERAVISLQEMLDHLEVFEKASNNDGVKFDKKCAAAVEKIKALSLLRQIRGSEGRFEISPTLKLLFSAEEVIALSEAYEKLKELPDASLDDVVAAGIRSGEDDAEAVLDSLRDGQQSASDEDRA